MQRLLLLLCWLHGSKIYAAYSSAALDTPFKKFFAGNKWTVTIGTAFFAREQNVRSHPNTKRVSVSFDLPVLNELRASHIAAIQSSSRKMTAKRVSQSEVTGCICGSNVFKPVFERARYRGKRRDGKGVTECEALCSRLRLGLNYSRRNNYSANGPVVQVSLLLPRMLVPFHGPVGRLYFDRHPRGHPDSQRISSLGNHSL